MKLLELRDIVQAKKRIDTHVNDTPVLTSSLLNTWLGHHIYFKAEGFQKTGAFKARGVCNTISWLVENQMRPDQLIANSSGNHAQALAWASQRFGIPATIYMPEYSSKIKIQATTAYGAKVMLSESRIITDKKVKQAAGEEGVYWIPPFNHEQVIAGQGTAAFEAIRKIGAVDAVFAPCGGGGLLSGTLIATRGLTPKAAVIGAEPRNANDAAESLRSGSIQHLETTPDTLADGVMTMAVGNITFEYLKRLDDFYEVDEAQIVYWTQWLTHILKIHVEPTSALAMEAARRWMQKQSGKKKILILLSGGNIDQATQATLWKDDALSELPALY